MSKNSKLFTVGTCEQIDIETGERVPVEGGGFKLLPGPPGTCEWCHTKHDAGDPHNKDSDSYQVKFQTIRGRAPTWSDAMAHCSDETKALWKRELVRLLHKKGLEIPEDLRGESHDQDST